MALNAFRKLSLDTFEEDEAHAAHLTQSGSVDVDRQRHFQEPTQFQPPPAHDTHDSHYDSQVAVPVDATPAPLYESTGMV